MKDRILKFLAAEQLSPAKFADTIGVQRSNISHVLSGRNNPSFDFITKMLEAYPQINAEWLIMGSGKMFKEMHEQSLFSNESISNGEITETESVKTHPKSALNADNESFISENAKSEVLDKKGIDVNFNDPNINNTKLTKNNIDHIIICYSDKTFDFYYPKS